MIGPIWNWNRWLVGHGDGIAFRLICAVIIALADKLQEVGIGCADLRGITFVSAAGGRATAHSRAHSSTHARTGTSCLLQGLPILHRSMLRMLRAALGQHDRLAVVRPTVDDLPKPVPFSSTDGYPPVSSMDAPHTSVGSGP